MDHAKNYGLKHPEKNSVDDCAR